MHHPSHEMSCGMAAAPHTSPRHPVAVKGPHILCWRGWGGPVLAWVGGLWEEFDMKVSLNGSNPTCTKG